MQLAIQDVKTGKSYRQASRENGVSYSTLCRRFNGGRNRVESHSTQMRLTIRQEEELVDVIIRMSKLTEPVTKENVRDLAKTMLKPGDKRPLGIRWVDNFLSRHPTLALYSAVRRDKKRIDACNLSTFESWYEIFEKTIRAFSIKQENMYNMGETGFQLGVNSPGKGQIKFIGLSAKGAGIHIAKTTCRRENLSVIECISAGGTLIDPFVILKCKNVLDRYWPQSTPIPGWLMACSNSGWTNNSLALNWLEHFDSCTMESAGGEMRGLVLDGHVSHVSDEFLAAAEAKGIKILLLPPHTSHALQPLHISFFGPLKTNMTKKNLFAESAVKIDKPIFLSLFNSAGKKS